MNSLFEKQEVVKSVMNSDRDVLAAVLKLYKPINILGDIGFDLDPCFSIGKFYEDLEYPITKYDKEPQLPQVLQNDLMNGIPLVDNSVGSIVFDPPFMFGKHGKTDENIMTKRFTMFDSWQDLEAMYKKAIKELSQLNLTKI